MYTQMYTQITQKTKHVIQNTKHKTLKEHKSRKTSTYA